MNQLVIEHRIATVTFIIVITEKFKQFTDIS